MKILFIAGRETSYPRNDVVIRALQRFSEVDVIGNDIKVRSIVIRSSLVFLRSISKILFNHYDVIYIGFYGYLLLAFVRLLTRRKILFDAFLSNFDTLITDRKVFKPDSFAAKRIYQLDQWLLRLPDFVLVDTREQVVFFINSFQIPAEKIGYIPVGCNQTIFYPKEKIPTTGETIVFHYSSYLPLHGTDTILKAANLLQSQPIRFILDGEGQEHPAALRLASELGLKNVTFTSEIQGILTDKIANADLCLGNFGTSAKSNRVIPGKTYQILAMARPLITGDTDANRSFLTDRQTAILCEPGNPHALADAILELHRDIDLRLRLGQNGYQFFLQTASEEIITLQLEKITKNILNS